MSPSLKQSASVKTAKIHIVEDEALIAESLSSSLSKLGYEVTGITDACDQTLAEISSTKPDCVLMDIRIRGEIDGIETTRRLREQYDIPVIYLSGQTDSLTIDRAKTTMAWGFLPKPVHGVALTASIEMAVHKYKIEHAHREDTLGLERTADDQRAVISLDLIKERKQIEDALHQSQRRLLSLVQGVKDYAILELDEKGMVCSWTDNAAQMKGYLAEEIVGTSFARFYTPEDVDRGHSQDVLNIAREKGHFAEEGWRVRKDGTRFWADVTITTLRDDEGNITGFSKMTRDITERHRSRKEREDLIGGLENALKEKTVLLQEVHHRVKNNLAVVAAFLGMQATTVGDERLTELLAKSQKRVASMALIHEYLYSNDHLNAVNFGRYAEQLAYELCQSYGIAERVNCVVSADDVELPIDSAIPCGLILNELLSNSLKYGFPNSSRGNINIKFCQLGESGEFSLSCQDDGVGVPEGFDWKNAASLGLKIVQVLSRQLKGKLSLDRSTGTRFDLTFPKI